MAAHIVPQLGERVVESHISKYGVAQSKFLAEVHTAEQN